MIEQWRLHADHFKIDKYLKIYSYPISMQERTPITAEISRTPVHIDRLYKRFGQLNAVDGVSFTMEPGSVTALLGGNGAGKTTMIAMILGLIVPTSGSVRVFGADMAEDRHKVLGRINFESPYVDMPMRLTVRQNLDVFGRLYGLRKIKERIAELAEEFRLNDILDRGVGKLSSGQKTRVSLAKALLNRPELLLLDEPTASLDPDTADWVRERLEAYRKSSNAAVLLASHNMLEVERLADRVILLDRGRIYADGSPDALIKEYHKANLEEVFLEIVRGREFARNGDLDYNGMDA